MGAGIGIGAEDTESMWLEADLIERGAFLEKDLLSAYHETIPEIESSEIVWPDSGSGWNEEFSGENHYPAVDEMVDFLESAIPTMFVCVGGKNFLIKKEDGVYGTSA